MHNCIAATYIMHMGPTLASYASPKLDPGHTLCELSHGHVHSTHPVGKSLSTPCGHVHSTRPVGASIPQAPWARPIYTSTHMPRGHVHSTCPVGTSTPHAPWACPLHMPHGHITSIALWHIHYTYPVSVLLLPSSPLPLYHPLEEKWNFLNFCR